jgi:hypothetical protein
MSVGLAIFASVVLILAVYNEPFRKIAVRVAVIVTGLAAIAGFAYYAYTKYKRDQYYAYTEYVRDQRTLSQTADDGPLVIEIHGGETLKMVPSGALPKGFVPDSFVPLVYLGRNQRFTLACGEYGESATPHSFPVYDAKTHNISCP